MDLRCCLFAACPVSMVCVYVCTSFMPTMSILILLFLKADPETAELFHLQVKLIIYHTCIIIFIVPHNEYNTLLEVRTIVCEGCDKQAVKKSLWLRRCSYRVYTHCNSRVCII